MFREHGAGLRPCLSAGAPVAPGAPHLQVLDRQEHALGTQVLQGRSSLTLKSIGGRGQDRPCLCCDLLIGQKFFLLKF